MQMLVPSYLEFTLDKLTNDQSNIRQQMESAFATKLLPGQALRSQLFEQLEEQTRTNMKLFSQALSVFNPFAAGAAAAGAPAAAPETKPASADDLDAVKRDMQEMQRRLDRLASKE